MGSVIILSFVKGKTAHGETHGRYLAVDRKKPRDVARGRRIGKKEPENSLFQEEKFIYNDFESIMATEIGQERSNNPERSIVLKSHRT